MVALAKRFRMGFAMDRLSNTRCSHARSTNISNDHYHAQCLQTSSTTTSSVDAQKHKSHPGKTSFTSPPRTPSGITVRLLTYSGPISPVVRLQRLHTCGRNPCQFPISKVCTQDSLSICALAVHLYLHNHE